jgi:phospholipase C
MSQTTRRDFLKSAALAAGGGAALTLFPPAIRRALAIPAHNRRGSLEDVEHVVILMMENRSFDHYFGALHGVRGFADPFPIPVPDAEGVSGKTVWTQRNDRDPATPTVLRPFHLDTVQTAAYLRVEDTPHTWSNTQDAWAQGRMDRWPAAKKNHSMAYYRESDLPFQYALANAFTVCDAYHASFFGGTNTNRLFLWSGTNDGLGHGHGPAIGNAYNTLNGGDPAGGYSWTTYPERLEAAGVSWQVYQDMADNYALNALAGFKTYRDAFHGVAGALPALRDKALSTRGLDRLKQDVLAGRLPQVSWICPTRAGSEHPSPSSPAQGAHYVADVLDALTAEPSVWSKTVLLLMYDENDGFFDHAPPPAPPSFLEAGGLAGASTVDTDGEYHRILLGVEKDDYPRYTQRPYGLGPRVPMMAISPWSKGGWVNSQVFDHTSVLRFLEQRFGVRETNISAWRRAVCGDLTSAFNFKNPNDADLIAGLPATAAQAARARALPGRTVPPVPAEPEALQQAAGIRPARALPYALSAAARVDGDAIEIVFENAGTAAAVFHVYDRLHLDRVPRRYTVEAGKSLAGRWPCGADDGRYDLWLLAPNGWHRHYTGQTQAPAAARPELALRETGAGELELELRNDGASACTFVLSAAAAGAFEGELRLAAGERRTLPIALQAAHGWYDGLATVRELPGFRRRYAGHAEDGEPSLSDPAMAGAARLDRDA